MMKCENQPVDIETKVRQDCYNRGYEQGRKDTAKEILEGIGNFFDECDDRFRLKDYQWHKELCKYYGVEVE